MTCGKIRPNYKNLYRHVCTQLKGQRRRGAEGYVGRGDGLPKQHKSNFEQHLSVLPTSMPFPVTPSAAY